MASAERRLVAAMLSTSGEHVGYREAALELGFPHRTLQRRVASLEERGVVEVDEPGRSGVGSSARPARFGLAEAWWQASRSGPQSSRVRACVGDAAAQLSRSGPDTEETIDTAELLDFDAILDITVDTVEKHLYSSSISTTPARSKDCGPDRDTRSRCCCGWGPGTSADPSDPRAYRPTEDRWGDGRLGSVAWEVTVEAVGRGRPPVGVREMARWIGVPRSAVGRALARMVSAGAAEHLDAGYRVTARVEVPAEEYARLDRLASGHTDDRLARLEALAATCRADTSVSRRRAEAYRKDGQDRVKEREFRRLRWGSPPRELWPKWHAVAMTRQHAAEDQYEIIHGMLSAWHGLVPEDQIPAEALLRSGVTPPE